MKYEKHFFICTNQKEDGQSCGQHNTKEICKNLKQHFREQGAQNIRVNQSGCLGECAKGPVMVVYPDGEWYQFFDEEDVKEIISTHIQIADIKNIDEKSKLLQSLESLKLPE